MLVKTKQINQLIFEHDNGELYRKHVTKLQSHTDFERPQEIRFVKVRSKTTSSWF